MPVDIVIIRSNSIVNSPRIRKVAGSLNKKYKTTVIGWNREGIPKERISPFITDLELLNFKSPFARSTIIFYFPIFWSYLFIKLVKYRPKIIHACDLDTLLPSIIFKTLFRKKILFDVCDRYAMSKISPRRRLLYSSINWLEEFVGKRADYMINVSKDRESTFRHRPENTAIIMNCADEEFAKISKKYNFECDDTLKLVYTGNIIRNRGLEQVKAAIMDLDNVQLTMAGKIIDQELLDELIAHPDIKYIGNLTLPEALGLEGAADVMVILYDTKIPNNRYSNPNKLFEAMMFGVPVITNVVAEIVKEVNCGVFLDYDDIRQLRRAIISLRDDPSLRKKLGHNGRIAFEKEYNWSSMEQILLDIYYRLLAD